MTLLAIGQPVFYQPTADESPTTFVKVAGQTVKSSHDEPFAALVTYVNVEDETTVNLVVFDKNGNPSGKQGVKVVDVSVLEPGTCSRSAPELPPTQAELAAAKAQLEAEAAAEAAKVAAEAAAKVAA